jgi:ABC-type branched-subunit amino acid transport system ATPase component
MLKTPRWAERKFWEAMGIGKLIQKLVEKVNRIKRRNFYKDLIFFETPAEVISDIQEFIKKKFFSNLGLEKLAQDGGITLDIFYSYKNRELNISILDITSTQEFINPNAYFKTVYNTKSLIEKALGGKLKQETNIFIRSCFREKAANIIMRKIQSIPEIDEIVMAEKVQIPCERTNSQYQYQSIQYLYSMPEVAENLEISSHFRKEVVSFITDLQAITRKLSIMVEKANTWGVKITSPEVVPHSIISFDALIPIHLIGRKDSKGKVLTEKDLCPIKNLPALQGQLLGLTGPNAGGKSVCHEAVMYNLFLAQTGLPIFGEGFTFSPKEFLGILSLEKGEGSTMELQIRKTKEIFDQIVGKNLNALLVLDEVGSGTSPDEGTEYAKNVLKIVAQTGTSCIFTTQLSEVAKYAETHLKAENYQLTKGYSVKPGIGKADIGNILEKEGLNKYFKQITS